MPSEREATRRWPGDIQHHIAMSEGFVAGIGYDSFKDDNLRLYAVTRCLEIISEASRRLPDEVKTRHPSIAWREMASAGTIYGGSGKYLWRQRVISIGMSTKMWPPAACGALLPSACRRCVLSSKPNWLHWAPREI